MCFYYTGKYRRNRIGKSASVGTHCDPKDKDRVSQVVLCNQQAIACICVQLKNNSTRNSQNCTRLCLVQLLDCYSYNYSLIKCKYMQLPMQSTQLPSQLYGTKQLQPCISTVIRQLLSLLASYSLYTYKATSIDKEYRFSYNNSHMYQHILTYLFSYNQLAD